MEQENFNLILRDYERKRIRALDAAAIRKEALYSDYPKLAEIEKSIANTSIQLYRLIISRE